MRPVEDIDQQIGSFLAYTAKPDGDEKGEAKVLCEPPTTRVHPAIVPRAPVWAMGAWLLASACSAPLCGEEPLDAKERACVFDTVWSQAAEHYPFFELKGIDWGAARADSFAGAMAAPDDQAFHQAIARLLARLQDGHSGLVYPTESWGQSVASLSVVAVDGRYFVMRVDAGSDAKAQGIQPGDEIASVDGEPTGQRFARAEPYLGGALEGYRVDSFARYYATAGPTPSAAVQVRDAAGDERTVSLQRGPTREFDADPADVRELPGGYGYIRVRQFYFLENLWRFDRAVSRFADAPGIVIDLRGNPGGSTTVSHPMASRFFETSTGPIVRYHKEHTTELSLAPRGTIYAGPVAILIDESVFSTSNEFASIFKFTGRGVLVGRTTGGGTGIPEIDLQLTAQTSLRLTNYYTELVDGTQTETTGTTPDIPVPITVEDLRQGLFSEPGVPAGDRDLAIALEALQRGGR